MKASEAVWACTAGHLRGLSSVLHKDFIQVIVDESALETEHWDLTWDLNLLPAMVLLYFLVLIWSSSHFKNSSESMLRHANGWYDDESSFVTLQNFIQMLNQGNGLQSILGEIRAEKKNFQGIKLNIQAGRGISGRWESTWRYLLQEFFSETHTLMKTQLLLAFSIHSFTYITLRLISFGARNKNLTRIQATFK